jgi:ATP-binding cassette, subfamily B, bacterial
VSFNRAHKGFHDVLGFTRRHWQRQPWLIASIAVAMIGATVADILMPVFAGHPVDAAGLVDADRQAARRTALAALAAILALGLAMIVMRHLAFLGIIRLALRIMAEMAQEAFWRVQRFSTEWHVPLAVPSCAGSRVACGQWTS